MRSLRRSEHEARVEIMPLIDVIFLLLTFFIYAMVLMVRAELLPMQMQAFASGEPAAPTPAVSVTIDHAGNLAVDRAPVTLDTILDSVRAKLREKPGAVVYVASEATGNIDRLPTFLALYDKLALAGLDIRLVGRPSEEP